MIKQSFTTCGFPETLMTSTTRRNELTERPTHAQIKSNDIINIISSDGIIYQQK